MRIAFPARRRLILTAAGLLAAAVLVDSCAFDAAVTTDRSGRVIDVKAVQIRSGTLDLVLALAREGRRIVLELRWHPGVEDAALALQALGGMGRQ